MRKLIILLTFLIFSAPFSAFAAIAFDASSHGNSGSSADISFSHTCTGTNLILIVAVGEEAGTTPTSVKYNGVALTEVTNRTQAGNIDSSVWYMINPPTGAHTITVSGPSAKAAAAASYTGANQSGQPDSFNTNVVAAGSSDTLTLTTTTVADNTWLVGAFVGNLNTSVSAGTGTTIRAQDNGGQSATALGDSNGAKSPAGSYSIVGTFSTSNRDKTGVVISIAPVAPPATITSILGLLQSFWVR